MRRKSFTLAEVLVTLMIIGIVSSMTIPGLLKNYQEKETVSQLLKTYSTVRQATLMIAADCDGNILSCISDPNAEDNDDTALNEIAALYKAKLKVVKDCGTGTGCLSSGTIINLDGTSAWSQDNNSELYKMILSDGNSMTIDWNGTNFNPINLYSLYIDINGKKPPNQTGRDRFLFAYNFTTGDLEPYGKNYSINTCNTSDSGGGCTQKVLLERAVNY